MFLSQNKGLKAGLNSQVDHSKGTPPQYQVLNVPFVCCDKEPWEKQFKNLGLQLRGVRDHCGEEGQEPTVEHAGRSRKVLDPDGICQERAVSGL